MDKGQNTVTRSKLWTGGMGSAQLRTRRGLSGHSEWDMNHREDGTQERYRQVNTRLLPHSKQCLVIGLTLFRRASEFWAIKTTFIEATVRRLARRCTGTGSTAATVSPLSDTAPPASAPAASVVTSNAPPPRLPVSGDSGRRHCPTVQPAGKHRPTAARTHTDTHGRYRRPAAAAV